MKITAGDVWFARFPFADDPAKSKLRPVIVMDKYDGFAVVLATMVTTHAPRDYFDVRINDYQLAGLHRPSVARISQTREIPEAYCEYRIGSLTLHDFKAVEDKFIEFIGG